MPEPKSMPSADYAQRGSISMRMKVWERARKAARREDVKLSQWVAKAVKERLERQAQNDKLLRKGANNA